MAKSNILYTLKLIQKYASIKNSKLIILLPLLTLIMANVSYAITIPSGIQYYLPITITNYQNTAVATNTPIAIGTISTGNIIGFNALAYQQYETCNLNNAEFFLANGMVLNSWMEGNLLNEQAANALCSSDTGNSLAASSNILYWVNIPTNTFLTANTGTATTNTLYLGWAGNVITATNNLLTNSIGYGEAPQLSSTYGYYDNGAKVFQYYQRFGGLSSLPAGWSQISGNVVFNPIYTTLINTDNNWDSVYTSTPLTMNSYPTIWDTYADMGPQYPQAYIGTFGSGLLPQSSGPLASYEVYAYDNYNSCDEYTFSFDNNNNCFSTNYNAPYTNNYIYSLVSASSTSATMLFNYTPIYSNTVVSTAEPSVYFAYGAGVPNNFVNIFWLRSRTYPPNGILPGTTYGAVASTCSASITAPSNSIADVGQYESFTASESNCISTFTYNVLIVNSISVSTITHNDLLAGQTASSVTYTFQTVSADTANSPEEAKVVITDSGSNTITSGYSSTFTINPALPIPTLSPSNPSIDSGQSITLTGTWSGGTPDYTVKWYTGPSGNTCAEDSVNVLATHSSLTGTSDTLSVSPTTTNSYCIGVTDSASTPVTQLSANDVVTVNPVLSVPTISPSNPSIDSGQSVTFSSTWSGGTPTYGASLYSSATPTCNQQSTLVQQDIGLSTNSVIFSSATTASTTYYCIFVTDNTTRTYSISGVISSSMSYPSGVAFSPSGTYAYLVNCNEACSGVIPTNMAIINTATNAINGVISSGLNGQDSVAFAPSGTYAYVTNQYSNNVVIINTATNSVTGSIISGFSSPMGVAISPSGTYAYVTNFNSNNIVIINTATNTVVNTITAGTSNPDSVAFSPDGSYAYVTNFNSNNILIINTATNTVVSAIQNILTNSGMAFAPSGTYAYIYDNRNVSIINTATNTISGSMSSGFSNPEGIAISPDGSYAYITNLNSNNVLIINTGVKTVNSINSEVTVSPALSVPTISPTNPSIDTGQSITLTGTWSGGTPDYTVKWYTGPSGNTCAEDSVNVLATHSSLTGTSDTLSVSPTTTNSYCIGVTDSASTPVTQLSANDVVTINPALSVPTISPSNPTIDSGQSVTFSSTWSGGTPDYTAKLYSSTTSTCNSGSTLVQTQGSLTSGSASFTAVSPTAATYYCIFVSDSAATVSTTNSVNSEVAVNPALSVPTISPSNPTNASEQSVTFSSTWSGGTPDYTAKLYSSTSSTCNTGNTLVQTKSSLTSGSASFNGVSPTSSTYYCIFVTDSATTPVTVNSINSEITINTGPQISNPYAGGSTGFFGHLPSATTITSSSTTTATTTTVSTTTAEINVPVITASGTTAQVCNDTHGYSVNYPLLNSTFYFEPSASSCFNVTASNATSTYISSNSEIIRAINYSFSNSSMLSNLTIHYPCNTASSVLIPVILRNGTWKEITPFTVNVAACTVTFAAPADPVIALLNTNSTTAPTPTVNTTTVYATTVPATPLPQTNYSLLILIIVIIVIIIAIIIYLRIRK